jgi:hypothetical protein
MFLNPYRFTAASTLSPLWQAISDDDPTAFWVLNESSGTVVHDASGNGHDGTYEPGSQLAQAAFVNGVPSLGGNGNASSYVVTVEDGAAFQPGSSDFTIAAGIKIPAGSSDRAIFTKERVGADYPEYALVVTSAGLLRFAVSSTNGGAGYVEGSSASRVDDNGAKLVIVEKSGSAVSVYVNGASVITFSFEGAVWDSSNKIGIGCSYIASNFYQTNNVSGLVSHVAWFNGTAIGGTRRAAYLAAFTA